MREPTHAQIVSAYRRMAEEARNRPAAPSDGLGNISVPVEDELLDHEAEDYARRWWKEEDGGQFYVGLCNYATRPATIFTVEAARALCGAQDDLARNLLRMRSPTSRARTTRADRGDRSHFAWPPSRSGRAGTGCRLGTRSSPTS